jgi:GT2 family glycosyltransferase
VDNNILISFIIPLFNHLKQSKEMLASLLATLPHPLNYEVVLIDDGSTDDTQRWMRQLETKNIHFIFNKINCGYAKSNNKAVRMAKGKILCLLNNDLILLAGWLEPMIDILYNPILNAGVVGNIHYKVIDNSLDHAGIEVNHLAKIEHIKYLSSTALLFNRTFAVTGACLLLFREDFIRAGGFDEQFENGCEDVDLCLKLRQQHKFSYVANTSTIKHHISLTRNVTSHVNEKNTQLLFSKWQSVIFQELNKIWLDLLCHPDENNAAQLVDFNLKDICYQKPQLASFMLANSVLQREETRWRENFNPNNRTYHKKMILKKVGFHWDSNHPAVFIEGKAWITLA